MSSEAVCNQLPAASLEYTPKGAWDTIAGLKTYVTSPPQPKCAILLIYDIFGPAPQTLQGADRLSAALDAAVLVPDFLQGTYSNSAWMPPDTEEKKQALQKFRTETAAIDPAVDRALRVREQAGQRWPDLEADGKWGVLGLCWGGKVGVLLLGQGNEGTGRKFGVGGTAHPSRLDVKDAEALTVPYICLASPGEPADVIARYKEILSQPGKVGYVETYESMFHGWMGARAKLDDEQNRAEYERGYDSVAIFFGKHL